MTLLHASDDHYPRTRVQRVLDSADQTAANVNYFRSPLEDIEADVMTAIPAYRDVLVILNIYAAPRWREMQARSS